MTPGGPLGFGVLPGGGRRTVGVEERELVRDSHLVDDVLHFVAEMELLRRRLEGIVNEMSREEPDAPSVGPPPAELGALDHIVKTRLAEEITNTRKEAFHLQDLIRRRIAEERAAR